MAMKMTGMSVRFVSVIFIIVVACCTFCSGKLTGLTAFHLLYRTQCAEDVLESCTCYYKTANFSGRAPPCREVVPREVEYLLPASHSQKHTYTHLYTCNTIQAGGRFSVVSFAAAGKCNLVRWMEVGRMIKLYDLLLNRLQYLPLHR